MTVTEMQQGFQEIWRLFAETDKKLEEAFRETKMMFQETDRKFQETDRKFQETDRKMEITDREFNKALRSAEATRKAVDDLTGKWGKFVESLIAPSVTKMFRERGIEVDIVYQRAKAHKKGRELEIDILAINGEYAVLIEAKSTLKVEDVNEHIERMEKFKSFFPVYADRKVVGAVAGIVIDEDADKYAYRQGLFVIKQKGESVKISNDRKFTPKIW